MKPCRPSVAPKWAAIVRQLNAGWLAFGAASAPALEIDYLYPPGGPSDSVVAVSAGGHFDAWPVRIWTDDPGLVFAATEAPGHFVARISPETRPGPHLVRFHHGTEVTAPRVWIVGDGPELTEVTSKDDLAPPPFELPDLPVVVNSRLPAPGARREFLLPLSEGVELIAEVVGHGLDAPLAARLRLLDASGNAVATSDRRPPRDPRLGFRVVLAGMYRLVIDAEPDWTHAHPEFAGGPAAVFRLGLNLRAQDDAPPPRKPDYRFDVPALEPPAPPAGLAAASLVRLPPGGRRQLAVDIRRPGASRGLLTLFATGLPEGVACPAQPVLPEAEAAVLDFTAATNAALYSGPFQITLVDAQAQMPVATNVKASLSGRYAPPGELLLRETEWFWLVVGNAPAQ